MHLAGAKKVQQVLAQPGVVEAWLEDEMKAQSMRACFAGMYPAREVVEGKVENVLADVLEHPLKYVLKPQREGGGYNIWGEEIVDTLKRGDK